MSESPSSNGSNEEQAHTFIQWKGTIVCMDIYCPTCQAHGHVDAEFVYTVRCKHCNTTYSVGQEVKLTIITEEESKGTWLERWFENPIVFDDHERPDAGNLIAHRSEPVVMLTTTELERLLRLFMPEPAGFFDAEVVKLKRDRYDATINLINQYIKGATN